VERLKRRGVRAPRDWQASVDKAFADPAAFRRKAKQFEKLALHGTTRRGGFVSYAPGVLPVVGGKSDFPALWSGKRVKDAIAGMSDGRCAYCQSNVSSSYRGKKKAPGEVEHFQPKALFPSMAYAWSNYFLGCGGCNGAKHDKWPREGYVRPDKGDPSKRFVFAEDGEMTAQPGDKQAENTWRDLELNRDWLKKHRGQEVQRQLKFLRVALKLRGGKLSRAQMKMLLVAPLSMFSAAINQNVRRAWGAGVGKKRRP
jgi:uncharacterized protein (TIGR02646 family)